MSDQAQDKTQVPASESRCKGYLDRGENAGPCPNNVLPKETRDPVLMGGALSSGKYCEFCEARQEFLSCLGPEMQQRGDEKCKSGMAIDCTGDICDRRAVWAGYCLHCLTYYDNYSNFNGVSETLPWVEYN